MFGNLSNPLICPPSLSGRLLDATHNYMWIFLLAGCEVVLAAVVLATCNFLFIKKEPSASADKLENITVTEECSKGPDVNDEEEKGAREEQEKETKEELKEKEKEERIRPASLIVDSQEVEKFLKEPTQNGDMANSPETSL